MPLVWLLYGTKQKEIRCCFVSWWKDWKINRKKWLPTSFSSIKINMIKSGRLDKPLQPLSKRTLWERGLRNNNSQWSDQAVSYSDNGIIGCLKLLHINLSPGTKQPNTAVWIFSCQTGTQSNEWNPAVAPMTNYRQTLNFLEQISLSAALQYISKWVQDNGPHKQPCLLLIYIFPHNQDHTYMRDTHT